MKAMGAGVMWPPWGHVVNYPRKWAYFTPCPALGLAKAYPARDIYQGCSVSIIYLLTEWEGQMGKCLVRGHDVRHGRSNPVNNYFILWLSPICYFSDFAPAAFLGAMRVIYGSLYYGPAQVMALVSYTEFLFRQG